MLLKCKEVKYNLRDNPSKNQVYLAKCKNISLDKSLTFHNEKVQDKHFMNFEF